MCKFLFIALCLYPVTAYAQVFNPGITTDQMNTAMATKCNPNAVVPQPEIVGGTAGSGTNCQLSNAAVPRITRATTCTLSSGVCSGTWSTALSANPTLVITALNTPGIQPVMCNALTTPTTTGYSIRCWIVQTTTLSLAIVTTGLNLAPATAAPDGTVVQIIAIPPTQ